MLLSVLSVVLLMITAVMGSTILNEGAMARRDAQMLLAQYEAKAAAAKSAPSSGPRSAETQPVQAKDPSGQYVPSGSPEGAVPDMDGYFFTANAAAQTGDENDSDPAPESIPPGYALIGKLLIQKLGLELPVISETTDAALKISVCRFQGPTPDEGAGNLVVTGHNYANGAHFGRLDELSAGDRVVLYTADHQVYIYLVYDKQVIEPDDFAALGQYQGEQSLMLLTCAESGKKRLLVRCKVA